MVMTMLVVMKLIWLVMVCTLYLLAIIYGGDGNQARYNITLSIFEALFWALNKLLIDNDFLPAGHYMKEVAIQQGAIFEAPFKALHELVLFPHPASKPEVVTGEGVDQHLVQKKY